MSVPLAWSRRAISLVPESSCRYLHCRENCHSKTASKYSKRQGVFFNNLTPCSRPRKQASKHSNDYKSYTEPYLFTVEWPSASLTLLPHTQQQGRVTSSIIAIAKPFAASILIQNYELYTGLSQIPFLCQQYWSIHLAADMFGIN